MFDFWKKKKTIDYAQNHPDKYTVSVIDDILVFQGDFPFYCQTRDNYHVFWGLNQHHITDALPLSLIPCYRLHVTPYGHGHPTSLPNALDVQLHHNASLMPSLHNVRLRKEHYVLHPDGYIRFDNELIRADFFHNGESRHRMMLPMTLSDIVEYQQIHTLMRTYLMQGRDLPLNELYNNIPLVTFEKILLQQELSKLHYFVPLSELEIM